MAVDRLKSMTQQMTGVTEPAHPFDPLTNEEIEKAVLTIQGEHGKLHYNAVTLWEPRKREMMAWLADTSNVPRPKRIADVVAIGKGSTVWEGLVDLAQGKILKWESLEGVQPLVCRVKKMIYIRY